MTAFKPRRSDSSASPFPPSEAPLPPDARSGEGVPTTRDHTLWAAMRRASLRACLRLAEASGKGRTAEELALHVIPLAEAIWLLANGHAVTRTTPVAALPVGSLLDALRSELLEEFRLLGDRVSATEMVSLLQAVESVRERLSDDPAHRFSSRFLGAAGVEALVEVAHDMRSPLASIVLLVETMRQGQSGPVTPIQERQLGLVYGASFGLSLLVNDIISLGKGGDRLLDAEQRPFSVSELLNSVHDIVLPIAEEKGIQLRIVLPDSDWRMGFASALHRVMLNLATNALKFTDRGKVELGAQEISRTEMELHVRDTGRGIPEHRMATLFDAFRPELDQGAVTFSSSGLGLATCRRLVMEMGGELWAEKNEDGGALFRLRIELEPASRIPN